MEIENLKKLILALSARVEDNVYKAVQSLTERDSVLAEEIIKSDPGIDDTEVAIEEECLKVLALHQPVAGDLRFIVSILKINSDLERMGDLAVNIAERAMFLATREKPDIPLCEPTPNWIMLWESSRSISFFICSTFFFSSSFRSDRDNSFCSNGCT